MNTLMLDSKSTWSSENIKKSAFFEQHNLQLAPKEEDLIEVNDSSLLSSHFKNFTINVDEEMPDLQIQVLKAEAQHYTVAWLVDQANLRIQSAYDNRTLINSRNFDFIYLLQTQSRLIVYDAFLSVPSTTLNNFPDEIELIPYHPTQLPNTVEPIKKRTYISDFELYARIGKGGFSQVYVGRKKDTGQILAIKQIKKGFAPSLKVEYEILFNEKAILLELKDTRMLQLHYAFESRYHFYLVLDYVPCGNLSSLLKKHSIFSEDQAKIFVAEALSDLSILHDKNILYRDLKSENLLLDHQGHVHVCDFGISKRLNPEFPYANTVCGTQEMMAPEVIKGDNYSFTADYYSLGTFAYELVTGNPPFIRTQPQQNIFVTILTQTPKIPQNLSPELQDFLTKLLVKSPAFRLGANGYKEIMNHPWLAGINFEKVKSRTYPSPFDLSHTLSNLKFNKAYQIKFETDLDIEPETITDKKEGFCYDTDQPFAKPITTKKQFKTKPEFSRYSESTRSRMSRLSRDNALGQSFNSSTNSIMNINPKESSISFSRNSDNENNGKFHPFVPFRPLKNHLRYERGREHNDIPFEETPMSAIASRYRTLTKPNLLASR